MAFSFYQSLRTLPADLVEATEAYRLSGWQRFLRLELPAGTIGLVWNAMMSFGGGWFFLAASEAISVLNQQYTLPGDRLVRRRRRRGPRHARARVGGPDDGRRDPGRRPVLLAPHRSMGGQVPARSERRFGVAAVVGSTTSCGRRASCCGCCARCGERTIGSRRGSRRCARLRVRTAQPSAGRHCVDRAYDVLLIGSSAHSRRSAFASC